MLKVEKGVLMLMLKLMAGSESSSRAYGADGFHQKEAGFNTIRIRKCYYRINSTPLISFVYDPSIVKADRRSSPRPRSVVPSNSLGNTAAHWGF